VTSSATAHRWRWLAFAAAVAAAVMDLLDSTIAQVAAPAIQRDLGGSYAVIEWITASYTLAMAVGLLTGGRLGDLFGRKRMLLIGMAGFIAASAACAAAVTPGELIAARVIQGAAGAVMIPQVFGLIRDLFAAEEIGKAFAVFSPVMGLSAMLGPIAAGGLISADILGTGWRMIFLVNLPVGAVALLAGARLLPSAPERGGARGGSRARLDLPGAVMAAVAMFLVVFPLVQGRELGWPLWLVVMLAASAPVLAGFAWYQVQRRRAGATPLIEPGIFTRRGYAPGVAFSVAFVGSMGGIVLVFNVFLQAGLGFSPWHSALTTAPWAAGAFVGSAVGGMSMARLGRRILHAGLVVEAAGLVAFGAVLHQAGASVTGASVTTLDLLAPMIVGGIGMGMVFVPLFDIVMAGVEPREMGSASGVLQAVNSMSMALGVAGLGALFFGLLNATAGRAGTFVSAAQWTVLATVALLACAFVVAFWLPRRAREMGAPGTAHEGAPEAALEMSVA
jgi:MFS family permease